MPFKNKEDKKKYNAEYRIKNKEALHTKAKQYYLTKRGLCRKAKTIKDKLKHRAEQKKYYEKNKMRIRRKKQMKYADPSYRETHLERMREYRKSETGKCRARAYRQTKEYRNRNRKRKKIQRLMIEHHISKTEAKLIEKIRTKLEFMYPKEIEDVVIKMRRNEGRKFTAMVVDGIPDRKSCGNV